MSIMNDSLRRFNFSDEITDFLNLLRERAAGSQNGKDGCFFSVIDELYGFLPPINICRHTNITADRELRAIIQQWNLSGILQLESPWDGMKMTLFFTGDRFFVGKLNLDGNSFAINPAPPLNQEEYQTILFHAERRLRLLSGAFGNPVLRHIGARTYLRSQLADAKSKGSYPACLEIFITLLNMQLTDEEQLNQDIFLKRARAAISGIMAYRAEFAVKDPADRQYAATAAGRKSHLVFNDLYAAANMIWGCLANAKFICKKSFGKEGYYFIETYRPDGGIELGEVLPALPGDKSGMFLKNRCDCYKQVFHDYMSACHFRNAALQFINC